MDTRLKRAYTEWNTKTVGGPYRTYLHPPSHTIYVHVPPCSTYMLPRPCSTCTRSYAGQFTHVAAGASRRRSLPAAARAATTNDSLCEQLLEWSFRTCRYQMCSTMARTPHRVGVHNSIDTRTYVPNNNMRLELIRVRCSVSCHACCCDLYATGSWRKCWRTEADPMLA